LVWMKIMDYFVAYAIVKYENNETWCWFLYA